MDDRELDIVLRKIAGERRTPSAGLLRRTKARIRGRRLLQVTVALSIAMQLAVLAAVIYTLASPQVPVPAKIFGVVSLIAWTGALAITVVGARGHVAWFFRRVEHMMG